MAFGILTAALLAGAISLFAEGSTMAEEKKPLVVFVTGDHEYGGEETLPILARELERRYGVQTKLLRSFPDQNAERDIPGLEALAEADLTVFFLRWRQLPREQVAHIKSYLDRGKPVVGFRTSTHAFNYPAGHELEPWNRFGAFALGAPPGWGHGHTHYGHDSSTDVTVAPDATRLLIGKAVNPDHDAVPNPVAWTWRTKAGGRVFMTTMGHPEDFRVEPFQRLLINGIHWALGRPVPERWAGKFEIRVPYRGIRKSTGS